MSKIRRVTRQFTLNNFQRVANYNKQYGFASLIKKLAEKTLLFIKSDGSNLLFDAASYRKWINENEPNPDELDGQKKYQFSRTPKISIVVPTYNTPMNFLKPMIESVFNQTYSNWELCVADGSTDDAVRVYLKSLISRDERVKVTFLEQNFGIAGNTNHGIDLATGEFTTLLDHDDTLSPFALYEVVKAINDHPEADMLYSDEDKLSFDGKYRVSPHFKPDWSPDTIRSYNYVTHLLVLKSDLLKSVGKIRSGFEGAQDFDLVLRVGEKAKQIIHIPKVLYHWREHRNSTSANIDSKTYVTFSTQRAVADALERNDIKGRVFGGPFFGSARVVYPIQGKPLVSIIIPTKDEVETLKNCIGSIINRTTYSNYEVIIVDTGSLEQVTKDYYAALSSDERIRLMSWDKPFNYSAVNNFAAQSAKGEYLLFLNNDTEVQAAEWIESMLEFCQRDDVGAVGAKLFYPDFTIQHAGVILGIGGIAGHSHKSFPRQSDGYFGRLSVPTNLSAVTAACVMMPAKVFAQVGGFDEGYPLAFNDVDLCLRIREKGYLIVWTPYAQLVHYESKTRGYEDNPEKQARFKKEIERFEKKWSSVLVAGDPYYNVNLTLLHEDFSLKRIDEN